MNGKLMIGWSEADITPDSLGKQIPLYGQYYTRIAKGIHSRLKSVILAVSSGDEYFITGSIDNGGCPQQFVDRLREEVAKRDPLIDTKKIFLNAIHTHSAPSIAFRNTEKGVVGVATAAWNKLRNETLTPEEYADFAIPVIADSIISAWKTGNPEESREHSAMRASDTAAAPFTPTEKRKCTETRRAPISSAWKRAKTRGSKCFSRSTNRESAPA